MNTNKRTTPLGALALAGTGLGLALLAVPAVEAAVNVRVQPSGNTAGKEYVLVNEARDYFGNVEGSASGNYECQWTFSDGTPPTGFSLSDPHYISIPKTFGGSGGQFVRLTCRDPSNIADQDSATIEVTVVPTDSDLRKKNSAIDRGLRYSYLQQNTGTGCFNGQNAPVASTGMALLALENQGHNLDSNDEDIYKAQVVNGLRCLFDNSEVVDIATQPCIGDPENGDQDGVDANNNPLPNEHDGKGIVFGTRYHLYDPSIAFLAVVNAASPATMKTYTAPNGPTGVVGQTLFDIVVDAKDYMSWAQTDNGPNGSSAGFYESCSADGGNTYVEASSSDGQTVKFQGYHNLAAYGNCSNNPGNIGLDWGDTESDTVLGNCWPNDPTGSYSYFGDAWGTGLPAVTHTYLSTDAHEVHVDFDNGQSCTLSLQGTEGDSQECGNGSSYAYAYSADGLLYTVYGYSYRYAEPVVTDTCDTLPGVFALDYADGNTRDVDGACDPWGNFYNWQTIFGYDQVGNVTHTYATPGDYDVTVAWNGGESCSMTLPVTSPTSHCGMNAWRYTENDNTIDNSVTQWPTLALLEAEKSLKIKVKQEVKTETAGWVTYSQAADGSFAYDYPGSWNNFAKTAGGLIILDWLEKPAADASVQNALSYLGTTYNTGSADYGNKGQWYSMYGFYKGMKLYGLTTLDIGGSPFAWEPDYDNYLVSTQLANNAWPGSYWISDQTFSAYVALAILAPEVAGLPPVAKAGGPYGPVLGGSPVTLDASSSFHQDPTKSIATYQWDFDASNGLWWTSSPTPPAGQGAVGQVVNATYPDTGSNVQYTATLRVIDNGPSLTPPVAAKEDTDTATVQVNTGNVPPVAVTNGPWAGLPNQTITFDGTASYDPNAGDSIAAYAWDLDGDGAFNEANGDDGTPVSAGNWSKVTKTYATPASALATLCVTDSHGAGGTSPVAAPYCSSNRFVAIALTFVTQYRNCWSTNLNRNVTRQGLAVTFNNSGDVEVQNLEVTAQTVPSNLTKVQGSGPGVGESELGTVQPGVSATTACDSTAKTADIIVDLDKRVRPSGVWTWKAEFDWNGTHYIIPNIPAI